MRQLVCLCSRSRSRVASARRAILAITAALLWLAMPGAAGAQQPQQPDLSQMTLDQLLQVEVDNVFAATKSLRKVTDVPASVTIVTAADIKRYGYHTLADVLRSVRGFYVSSDRNYTYVGVRGFGRPGDYNIRVLLLINGHRANDSVYDGAYIGGEFLVDMDLVERVEIVRGPGSALYGTSAFFAVINVVTKKAQDQLGVRASTEIGSLRSYRGRLTYGAQLGKHTDLLLSGTFSDSGGNRSLYYPEFDSPATNFGVARNGDSERFGSLFVSITHKNLQIQSAIVSRRKYIPTGSYGSVFNDPRTFTVDSRGYLDVSYTRELASRWKLTGRVYYDRYYYDGEYVYDYGAPGSPDIVVNQDYARGEWWGLEASANRTFGSRHDVTLGTEYRNNFRQDQGNFDVYGEYLRDHRGSQTWAVFLQDDFAIAKKLRFVGGLRYDHYEGFGGTVNPRLGLIFSPTGQTTIKALYGHAFRAPNPFEKFYQTSQDYKTNPLLRPETIHATEIALEHYFHKHFRLSASAYWNDIHNLISQRIDPADGRFQFLNAESVVGRGLEFEAEARWAGGWRAQLGYTLQDSRDQITEDVLTNSPKHLLKLRFGAPLFGEKLYLGYEGDYTSARRTVTGGNVGGRALSNLTLSSGKLLPKLEFSAGVYNLFNKRYADPGAAEHIQTGIPQDGRTFRFKLTYQITGRN